MTLELRVPAEGSRNELLLRAWQPSDMEELRAEMARDHPSRGLHPPGPRDASGAADWLSTQVEGWRAGDWLSFGVFERRPDGFQVVGQVGLKPRESGRPVAECEVGEVSYWTAVSARGRGIATAAVEAVTTWALGSFTSDGLRDVWLVHDLDNAASCRVAEKTGYAFRRVSPPNPPKWSTAAHIHSRRR